MGLPHGKRLPAWLALTSFRLPDIGPFATVLRRTWHTWIYLSRSSVGLQAWTLSNWIDL